MTIFLFICMIVMPIISIICLIWFLRDLRQSRWIEDHGIETQAHIIGLIQSGFLRPRFYFIAYEYEVNKKGYSLSRTIGAKTFRRLKMGSAVTIKYAPDNPQFSRLSGDDTDHTDRFYALLIGLPIAIIWLAFLIKFLGML